MGKRYWSEKLVSTMQIIAGLGGPLNYPLFCYNMVSKIKIGGLISLKSWYMTLYLVGHFWLIWYFDHFVILLRNETTWDMRIWAWGNKVSHFHLMRLPSRLVFEMQGKKVFLFACLLLACCIITTLTQVCSNPFANRDYYRLYYSHFFHSTTSSFRSGVISLS